MESRRMTSTPVYDEMMSMVGDDPRVLASLKERQVAELKVEATMNVQGCEPSECGLPTTVREYIKLVGYYPGVVDDALKTLGNWHL